MSTYDLEGVRHVVLVCHGESCRRGNAEGVLDALRDAKKECGLRHAVHAVRTRCLGRCDDACNVLVLPDGAWYGEVSPKLARRIVREHLQDGTPVADALRYDMPDGALRRVSGKKGKPKK